MHRFLFQSLLLIVSFLAVFLWEKSDFAVYSVPALGIMTALYLIANFKKNGDKYRNQLLTVFLLNTSALLLIQATGGIYSFLFFLLYFLSFFISFTLIPETVFVFCVAIILLYFPQAAAAHNVLSFTQIFSFLLLCPLAYFFGKEITMREKREQKIEAVRLETTEKVERIMQDVSDIVKNEGASLKEQDVEKLKDIVEQSKELEKESKMSAKG